MDRKFALPYIGPYIITELQGKNNVYIRLENSTQEPFLVNVDQLSRCYAGLSVDGPLQFTHMVRPRQANRKRRARPKAEMPKQVSDHQMVLRQMDDLDFDGVTNSVYTARLPMHEQIGVAVDSPLRACARSEVITVPINSLMLFSDRISNFGRCEEFIMVEKRQSNEQLKKEEYACRKRRDEMIVEARWWDEVE